MKPASASSSDTPLEQRRQTFRDLVNEGAPLTRRAQEIGIQQCQMAFEINLEIAQRRFPLAKVSDAAATIAGEVLPQNCIASPHDIPRKTHPTQPFQWVLATLVPIDDGRSAETICQYLIDAKVEPSEILIQRHALRVLLVR